ncbi:MAG: S8 family serine peptidase, partial [Gammaproteobacteria bacterium]|nr:S8 family serine peptidase [Gammaproteobacteria bacterium]
MKQLKLVAALGVALAAAAAGISTQAASPQTRVWVKFTPGASAQVESQLRAAGGKIHYKFANLRAFAVSVPEQALAGLRNNPNIEYIEADAPRRVYGETVPYGIPRVQAPEAVSVGADGTGIKVCVIDSGIHADHEDLSAVAKTGYASSGQSWNTDSCGHGTHVAGTVAAVGNNGKGVIGVSPGKVALHIVKVFDGTSCGWSYSSTLVNAAQNCQNAGAKIISMSLGGSTKSTTEESAFNNLDSAGILSIAAAGNAGNTSLSYPASYTSVMSVAATDSTNTVASFSQKNSQVEIAAPGVGVLSTYPIKSADVTVGTTSYIVSAIEGVPQTTASGALTNGGRCTSAGSWAGKVVLCERGDISFADKVTNAKNGGAVGVIIYNNVPGGFSGTMNGVATTIPAVSMTQEDGQSLVNSTATASVSTVAQTNTNGYAYLDGTSMATPHVSGVAALAWSSFPTATNQQVRDALTSTAIDLGTAGRDTSYGYGLV